MCKDSKPYSNLKPLKISRILHAGYVFEFNHTKILIDPIFENPFSTNCFAFPRVEFDIEKIRELSWDAVFISHFHDDHCSLASLNLLPKDTPIYIYCEHDEIFEMIRELGFYKVNKLYLEQSVVVGEFMVKAWPAMDPEVDCLLQIKANEINVLNVVDSWIDYETVERLARAETWDLILWPFQTLRELEVVAPELLENKDQEVPWEWVEQLRQLKPRYLVPSSCQFQFEEWSWYNRAFFPITYKNFLEKVTLDLPTIKTLRLEPSESVEFSNAGELKRSDPLRWISLIDKTPQDFHFEPNLKPQLTSEIALKFSPLTNEQTDVVNKFLSVEIFRRFSELDSPELPMRQDGRWQLSLFNHLGQEIRWNFLISDRQLLPTSDSQSEPIWKTEISMWKLYSALEEGEALTSLYIRTYHPDVLADPLIRCLYSRGVGSYQRAQLRRIVRSLRA